MDMDKALFARASGDGFRLLRIYRFAGNSVTVGRTFRGDLPEEWQKTDPEVAVRPTGGGAVWHRGDLCFSFFSSPRPPVTLKEFYRLFHGWLNRFLETRTIQASCLGPDRPSPSRSGKGLCFSDPVPGDLLVGDRKVLGGALRISGRHILYQGSLLISGLSPEILAESFVEWYEKEGSRILMEEIFPVRGLKIRCPV